MWNEVKRLAEISEKMIDGGDTMERIQRLEQATMMRFHGNESCAVNVGDLEYLLAENKRLRLALEDVVDYQLRWSDSPITEVKKIAKEALREEGK